MNDICKILLIGLIITYVISPADACAGPIDDILVVLLGMVANKTLTGRKATKR